MSTNLLSTLTQGADRFGDRPALLAPDRLPLSHRGLLDQVQSGIARLQAAGVSPASRVAVVVPSGPLMASLFLTVASCAGCAPLNPSLSADELRASLLRIGVQRVVMRADETGAAGSVAAELGLAVTRVIDDPKMAGRYAFADPLQSPSPSPSQAGGGEADLALLLGTSGTTGSPKLVPLTHRNVLASARSNAAVLQLGPDDCGLGVMPLFHVGGLVSSLLSALVTGGSFVCIAGYDGEKFFDWVARFRPTWYTAGPTLHQAILSRGDEYRRKAPDHRFRFVRSASAALPATLAAQLGDLFGAPVNEAYGMTEAGRITSNPLPPGLGKPGSAGVAVGGQVAIMGSDGSLLPAGLRGEIVVRGDGVMNGYDGDPQATERAFVDGWFRTGDLGWLDDDGYLFIDGRLREMINRGGQQVAPREVDEAMLAFAGVTRAVLFPVPHPTLGEDLAAAVVMAPGAVLDERALRRFLAGRLSAHKVPMRIVQVAQIPLGPTGKVNRLALAGQLARVLADLPVGLRTDTENLIADLWLELLGCRPTGPRDNFFALGGDSLRAARVTVRLNERLDLCLAASTLFEHPCLDELAEAVDAAVLARDLDLLDRIESLDEAELTQLLEQESAQVTNQGGR